MTYTNRFCVACVRSGQNALLSQSQSSKGRISGGNITDGGGGGAGGGGLWGSLSGVLFSRAGEGLGGGGRRGAGTAAEASIGAIAEVGCSHDSHGLRQSNPLRGLGLPIFAA